MFHPRFMLQIGSSTLDSQVPADSNSVVGVCFESGINTAAPGRLTVEAGGAGDLCPEVGESVVAQLGYGEDTVTVFTGEVVSLSPEIDRLRIIGSDSMHKLVSLRLNQTYEQQTAGYIVSDLASQADVQVSNAESGIEFPFYVADSIKNAAEHVLELAGKCGFAFYFDADDGLYFGPLSTGAPVRTFRYGLDVLGVNLSRRDPMYGKVEVWGESPASSQGVEKAHWLVKDFADSLGASGSGSPAMALQYPDLKTKEAADLAAAGALEGISAKRTRGRIRTLGAADVMPGHIIAIEDFPDNSINGDYRVVSIRHMLNKPAGFISEMIFQAKGGEGI